MRLNRLILALTLSVAATPAAAQQEALELFELPEFPTPQFDAPPLDFTPLEPFDQPSTPWTAPGGDEISSALATAEGYLDYIDADTFNGVAGAQAYIDHWRNVVTQGMAAIRNSSIPLNGQIMRDYNQHIQPLATRLLYAISTAQAIRQARSMEALVEMDPRDALPDPIRQAVDAAGGPQAFVTSVLADRPRLLEMPGLQMGVALTLGHPATLDPPIGQGWLASADPVTLRATLTNASDLPATVVRLQLNADGFDIHMPRGGRQDSRITCSAPAQQVECITWVDAQGSYSFDLPLRPHQGPLTSAPPHERQEIISLTGTAETEGQPAVDLPVVEIALPMRNCNALFAAELEEFFGPEGAFEIARQAIAEEIGPLPSLSGRRQMPTTVADQPGVTYFGVDADSPIAPEAWYRQVGAETRNSLISASNVAITGRLQDQALRTLYPQVEPRVTGGPLAILRDTPRVCPASAGQTLSEHLRPTHNAIIPLSQRYATLAPQAERAGELMRQSSRLFREAYRSHAPDGPDQTADDTGLTRQQQFRLENATARTAYSYLLRFSAEELLTEAAATAVKRTLVVLGGLNLRNTLDELYVERQEARELVGLMNEAIVWTENYAYLEALSSRHRDLRDWHHLLLEDYRAIHDRNCTCRLQ